MQMLGQYPKFGHDRFFHILSNPSFIYNLFIWRYILWVTEKASLKKLKINKQIDFGGNAKFGSLTKHIIVTHYN
jgi:hypothetical protein